MIANTMNSMAALRIAPVTIPPTHGSAELDAVLAAGLASAIINSKKYYHYLNFYLETQFGVAQNRIDKLVEQW